MNNASDISERLKKLRKESGLSQEKFAAKLFLSRGMYNGLETGREKPSPWVVQQINFLEQAGVDLLNRLPPFEGQVTVEEQEQATIANSPAGRLKKEIRDLLEATIEAAADDPARLGWIREQVREYLSTPKSWRDLNAEAREHAKKLHAAAKQHTAESGDHARRAG